MHNALAFTALALFTVYMGPKLFAFVVTMKTVAEALS